MSSSSGSCVAKKILIILRRIRSIWLLVLILPLCASLAGCSYGKGAIGVLETSGDDSSSRIAFYNSDLQRVHEMPLGESGLNSLFYDPVVLGGVLYVIPQGSAASKDARKVIGIDLSTLAISEYGIQKPAMNSVAASDEFVYTCNTLNGTSSINRCDKRSGEIESVDIEGVYVSYILVEGKSLYAFLSYLDESGSAIYQYDLDLNRCSEIDISDFGSGVYRSQSDGQMLYFTTLVASDGSAGGCLAGLDMESGNLSRVDVPENPLCVKEHEGRLYVSHGKLVEGCNESGLSVIDTVSGEIETYHFDHGIDQMLVNSEGLYILSGRRLYRYQTEDISLIYSTALEPVGSKYHYVSGFFDAT